jgi:hypothetical protein
MPLGVLTNDAKMDAELKKEAHFLHYYDFRSSRNVAASVDWKHLYLQAGKWEPKLE